MTSPETSRRTVLSGLAAAGAALPLIAACGNGDSTGSTSSAGTDAPGTSGGSASSAGGGIPTSEIPVGGGKIFSNQQIVVTQPKAGEFKAFSAICTHQGCPVTEIRGGTIDCTCHGSQYSIVDGSVEGGPAPRPLPEMTVTVTGTTLTVS